jgi:ribonuclease BN (tRNA processing enzyme)
LSGRGDCLRLQKRSGAATSSDSTVQVTLLPSAFPKPGEVAHHYLTSYLINDNVAVDAGALGLFQSPDEQARVRHVFISHTHFDHLASLPIFVDNAYERKPDSVAVHGSEPVLKCLREDVFSRRLWANYLDMAPPGGPFLRLNRLQSGESLEVEGLRITPVEVNHTVPTLGFLIEDAAAAIVIPSDTGPTDEIWARARQLPRLKAVFLEASFPDAQAPLAEVTRHLTPATFAREIAKLQRPARIIAVHLKARHHARVAAEIAALGLEGVEVVQPGAVYQF